MNNTRCFFMTKNTGREFKSFGVGMFIDTNKYLLWAGIGGLVIGPQAFFMRYQKTQGFINEKDKHNLSRGP